MRILFTLNVIIAIAFLSSPIMSLAQDPSSHISRTPPTELVRAEASTIRAVRQNVYSLRKQLVAANLPLTGAEAEKFWPVYEQYMSEQSKIDEVKLSLMQKYMEDGGELTDAEAESSVMQWPEIDQSLAQLSAKYVPEFRKVLSARETARFFELNRRIQLFIDIKLASDLPLIEP